MCREIRSERLSVKVNAARIRQAASWPGMRRREIDRDRDRREKERDRRRCKGESDREEEEDEMGNGGGRWEPNWSKLASLVISGVSGCGGGST